jgi:hypothetical protein
VQASPEAFAIPFNVALPPLLILAVVELITPPLNGIVTYTPEV